MRTIKENSLGLVGGGLVGWAPSATAFISDWVSSGAIPYARV